MWTLDELDLAYEHIPAGGDFGLLDTPEFRRLNPHGKVPVIDDNGAVVWDSNAIVRYLAAEYDSGGLWPPDPRMRALADRWMEWEATTLQPHVMGHFWGWWRTPEPRRNAARNAELWQAAGEAWAKLDAALANQPHVAGDRLTMGDIPAGALTHRYFTLPLERPALPNVEAWRARLAERPAYRRYVAIPYDDLFGRAGY
jgi:glutathione S-transferase